MHCNISSMSHCSYYDKQNGCLFSFSNHWSETWSWLWSNSSVQLWLLVLVNVGKLFRHLSKVIFILLFEKNCYYTFNIWFLWFLLLLFHWVLVLSMLCLLPGDFAIISSKAIISKFGRVHLHTHANSYLANSYPSRLVPTTNMYPSHWTF